LDAVDAVHVLIDVGQGRQAYLPEPTRSCSGGSFERKQAEAGNAQAKFNLGAAYFNY